MIRIGSKISHRLFVTLVLIAVIPICIMGYGTYSAAQRALPQTAFLHLRTVAGDHANHLDAWFDERLHDIDVLSRLPAVAEVCKQHCQAQGFYSPLPEQVALLNYVIALTQGRSPAYASVHVLALTGELLASTDSQSQDLADFQQLPVLEQLRTTDKPAGLV